jgi:hypothetical protein
MRQELGMVVWQALNEMTLVSGCGYWQNIKL